MAKIYNEQTFTATIGNETITFNCYTTETRNGFCHHANCEQLGISARVSYCNRTWESFRYQTVLRECISKLKAKSMSDLRSELKAQIIDRTEREEHERCESMAKAFKSLWENSSDKTKESIKNAVGEDGIQSESEMHAVMGMMALSSIMEK